MSEEAGLFNRDFLLALPNSEGTGLIGAMGKYYHASQMSQALLGELVMSQRKQDELEGVGRPGGILLCQGAGTVWSEHSERATLRSWAASLGSTTMWPSSWADGRTRHTSGPSGATWRRRRRRWPRSNLGGPDKLDEESILEKVVEKLAMQEMDANDVEDQKLRLTSQGGIFASILGKDSWQASEKDPLERRGGRRRRGEQE